MSSRLKHGLLISIAVIALFFTVEHGYGATIQYIYDENGNLVEKRIVQTADTTPPTTTAIPAGGTFGSGLQVALSCHDGSGSGCDKTYYSTDGQTPTTVYSSPISISATTTLKFYSKDKAGNSEQPKTETYTISPSGLDTTPPATTPSPAEGFYTSAQSVTLTCTDAGGSGCDKIYYTIDGSTPTTSSPIYSTPINITVTTTLKFFARDLAGNTEAVNTAEYLIDRAFCTDSPVKIGSIGYSTIQAAYNAAVNGDVIKCREGLTFVENLTINRNIAVNLEGGWGCGYTTGGGIITTIQGALTTTPGGGTITVKNIILSQAPSTPPITPDTTPPTTTAYPPGGTYNSAQSVLLVCADTGGSGCDKIYYTTDGSTPNLSSPVYSTPINISTTTTLKFFARDAAGNSEAVKTEVYTIDTSLPTTIATPAAGTYYDPQVVTLSCTDASGSGCDKVYYTTDGTTPTTSSAVYSAPFNISETTTLKFFGVDFAGNTEAVKTATYIIDPSLCSNPLVRVGSASYTTLQAAYNAAADGDTIQCRNMTFTENLAINRSIAVTLEGGWDCGYTTTAEIKTTIDGSLTTTAGTLILKNFFIGKSSFTTDHTPPTTTATPAGNTYNTSLLVILTCDDGSGSGCDKIYYTTDGTTPITTSPVYSAPIDISVTTTLKFFSRDLAGNIEAVKTETYTIGDTTPPTTTASPAGGIYNTSQSVTLTCTDASGSGCDKIYYTTDGSTPTTSSPVYSAPINITATTTLKFFARDLAANSEAVKTQTYTIDTTPPTGTITINSGAASTNNVNVTLTLSCNDANGCSQMQFSNDNVTYSTPEAYSTSKVWSLTTGDGSKTVYVKFKDTPGNWSVPYSAAILLDTTPPTTGASPAGGTYTSAQSVTLSCTDASGSGCDKIYYTIDGTTPTTSSPVYSAPINIATTTTLKFFAKDLAGNSEAVKTQTYTIDTTLPTGTITINSGAAYTNSINATLTLSCNDANGCSQMQFSNDNVTYLTPETYATSKAWSLTTGDGSKTVYVKFKDTPGNWSVVYTYTILLDTTLPTTTASPAGGTYGSAQSVTLSCSDASGSGCDKIYYTTDGSTPTTSSPVYTSPINISVITTLEFFAKDRAGNSEAVRTQTYTIDTSPPTGTITINSGTAYTNSTNVTLTLSCNDANGCSQMQFSNDNVTYSTAEAYATTKAWSLTSGDGTKTVYVKFKDTSGNWSVPYSAAILLDTTPATTGASPAGGTYTSAQSVTLSCSDGSGSGCDKIYYTTDGSTPTTSSPVYSSPVNISVTATLKFFAKDLAANSEAVKTQTYTIDTTLPTGTITINSGAAYTNSINATLTLSCNDANGCSQMQFSNDNVTYSTAEAYATTKAWTLSAGDGNKPVYAKFKDTPGNWSVPYSAAILLDTAPPTSTATPAGGTYTSAQSVTLSCSDGSGSGCDKIYYTTDGSTPTTSSPVYSAPINIATTTTLKFFAKDLPGNIEAVKTQTYTIDTTPPSGTITINPGAAYTNSINATVTLSCNDANGCSQMQFSNDNVTYSTTEAYATTKAWSLTSGDGTKTVYVKFKDTPGNWSVPYSAAILLDTTPPTSTATPAGGTYTSAQSVTLSCSDGSGSGCDKIYYTTDGSTPTPSSPVYSAPINISATTTLKFFAKDLAGNSEAVKTQIYTINATVTIGGLPYTTLQAAYNAAINGDVIKCRNITFTENLTVNRNITVTLDGGYDSGFTTNAGGATTIKGSLTTTAGGGTITIRNLILAN